MLACVILEGKIMYFGGLFGGLVAFGTIFIFEFSSEKVSVCAGTVPMLSLSDRQPFLSQRAY